MTPSAEAIFVDSDPLARHRPHRLHSSSRVWPETNCYMDLWIEALHWLGHDPVPALACVLSGHFDQQWSFAKMPPEDLRKLYGVEVEEINVWRPVIDHVVDGLSQGVLHTVEVDSWWLPDTSATAYRRDHVKTTIMALRVHREERVMVYLHNAGLHRLSDDDFDGVFGLAGQSSDVLLPYVESVRVIPTHVRPGAALSVVRDHLDRRPSDSPVVRLASSVAAAREWLPQADEMRFHSWSFATLRHCGFSAELAADLAGYLDVELAPGAAAARADFLLVAELAKSVQFKMARAARGRKVDVCDHMADMSDSWARAMDTLHASVITAGR